MDEGGGMTSEDFNAVLQAAVQAAVQTAMSAVAAQQGAQSATLTVGDDTPLIEGAAAATAQDASAGGGGESMPYFVPGFGGGGSDAPKYVCGSDSNIKFGNETGGKIPVDVYYV